MNRDSLNGSVKRCNKHNVDWTDSTSSASTRQGSKIASDYKLRLTSSLPTPYVLYVGYVGLA